MKQQSITLVKTYLNDIQHFFPLSLETLPYNEELEFEQRTEISIDVKETEAMSYIVDMYIDIYETLDEQDDFRIKLDFSSLVKINNMKLGEKGINKILRTTVPRKMFPFVQKSVKSISEMYGFPPVLIEKDEIESVISSFGDTSLEINKEPKLGYNWIIHNILSTKEGASFLDTLKRACGNSCLTYTQTPLYRYFYRFLKPIKYNHPNYDECDDEYWDMLLQFIIGESQSVDIIECENGYPDIEFEFQGYEKSRISEFSLEELKELTSDIAVESFTSTMVTLYKWNINEEYCNSLQDDEPPLVEELETLYNIKDVAKERPCPYDSDDIDTVEFIFNRIQEYSDKTFEYRLLSESN